jgi:RimJ/RimL family protein N-acetyltransferase
VTSLSQAPDADAAGDVLLRDGTRVHIRPIRPEDDRVLVEGFHQMSPLTVYQRFFSALPELSEDMAWHLSHVNYTNRMALIAETADANSPQLMGVARYDRTPGADVSELGLVVLDQWQGRGLGRILLREILRVAARNGLHRFTADILADNRRMLHLLATEAEIVESKSSAGVTTLLLSTKADVGG